MFPRRTIGKEYSRDRSFFILYYICFLMNLSHDVVYSGGTLVVMDYSLPLLSLSR